MWDVGVCGMCFHDNVCKVAYATCDRICVVLLQLYLKGVVICGECVALFVENDFSNIRASFRVWMV